MDPDSILRLAGVGVWCAALPCLGLAWLAGRRPGAAAALITPR